MTVAKTNRQTGKMIRAKLLEKGLVKPCQPQEQASLAAIRHQVSMAEAIAARRRSFRAA